VRKSKEIFEKPPSVPKGFDGRSLDSVPMLQLSQIVVLVLDVHLLVVSSALLRSPVKQLSSIFLSALILFTVMVMTLTWSKNPHGNKRHSVGGMQQSRQLQAQN
jgi:hypothetical protein